MEADKSEQKVTVWMSERSSYVENFPGVIFRIKNASQFGKNVLNMDDGPKNIQELPWESLFKLRPTVIELVFGRNPWPQIIYYLEDNYSDEQIALFFERVKILSLRQTDVNAKNLMKLLERFTLLAGFTCSETNFNRAEWAMIMKQLRKLNLRGIDLSQNVVQETYDYLDVSLLKLSGNPGVDITEFTKGIELVTVRTLIVEELFYEPADAGRIFLSHICATFPRLRTLIWDWNVIDPEIVINDDTKEIVKQIGTVATELALEALAVVAYTPNDETKYSIQQVARILTSYTPNVQLHQFSSKGISNGKHNFSIVIAGTNLHIRRQIMQMYIEERSTMPPIGKLLQLNANEIPQIYPALTIDFAGFDNDHVKQVLNFEANAK
ncbi:unnamed protein product [Caenorhabditis bovis]|uniref:Uncharacterized protein n=1 Tax=Caenorhabditis bovis TaxID=2654633 RepID=A0A8S1E7B6_9PELO|nr:unnamed protein product [Caenorhabditis bovis]